MELEYGKTANEILTFLRASETPMERDAIIKHVRNKEHPVRVDTIKKLIKTLYERGLITKIYRGVYAATVRR